MYIFFFLLLVFIFINIYIVYFKYTILQKLLFIYFIIFISSIILILKNLKFKNKILNIIAKKNYLYIIQKLIIAKFFFFGLYLNNNNFIYNLTNNRATHEAITNIGSDVGIRSETINSILPIVGYAILSGCVIYAGYTLYNYLYPTIPPAPASAPTTIDPVVPAPASAPTTIDPVVPAPASAPTTIDPVVPAPASAPSHITNNSVLNESIIQNLSEVNARFNWRITDIHREHMNSLSRIRTHVRLGNTISMEDRALFNNLLVRLRNYGRRENMGFSREDIINLTYDSPNFLPFVSAFTVRVVCNQLCDIGSSMATFITPDLFYLFVVICYTMLRSDQMPKVPSSILNEVDVHNRVCHLIELLFTLL